MKSRVPLQREKPSLQGPGTKKSGTGQAPSKKNRQTETRENDERCFPPTMRLRAMVLLRERLAERLRLRLRRVPGNETFELRCGLSSRLRLDPHGKRSRRPFGQVGLHQRSRGDLFRGKEVLEAKKRNRSGETFNGGRCRSVAPWISFRCPWRRAVWLGCRRFEPHGSRSRTCPSVPPSFEAPDKWDILDCGAAGSSGRRTLRRVLPVPFRAPEKRRPNLASGWRVASPDPWTGFSRGLRVCSCEWPATTRRSFPARVRPCGNEDSWIVDESGTLICGREKGFSYGPLASTLHADFSQRLFAGNEAFGGFRRSREGDVPVKVGRGSGFCFSVRPLSFRPIAGISEKPPKDKSFSWTNKLHTFLDRRQGTKTENQTEIVDLDPTNKTELTRKVDDERRKKTHEKTCRLKRLASERQRRSPQRRRRFPNLRRSSRRTPRRSRSR